MSSDVNMPALTEAEKDLIDAYLRLVDLMARLNPARARGHLSTHGCVTAAQAMRSAAAEMLRAAETMIERGETELHAPTLAAAMLALNGEQRTARLLLRPTPYNPDSPP